MEALKGSLRWESRCGGAGQSQGYEDEVLGEDAGWLVERGSFLGDGFSVDDLLDLGEDEQEAEEDEVGEEFEAEDEARRQEKERSDSDSPSSSSSSSSSTVTFEPPPPALSNICLPVSSREDGQSCDFFCRSLCPLLQAHDVEQLEWVSYIIDDSISEYPPPGAGDGLPTGDAQREDRRASDSAAQGDGLAPSVCALSTEAMALVKAKRSKRPRSAAAAAAWSMSGPLSLADSSCSSTDTSTTTSASSCSSNIYSPLLIHHPCGGAFDQSFLLCGPPPKNQKPKKKRGRKPKPPPPSSAAVPASCGERRCSHCGVQKTPQWRAGPLGAKTLCNACGVRFKSGRLLPEYRPACSPTFVSQLHSNSHRKVLEMRRKKEADFMPAAAPPVASF